MKAANRTSEVSRPCPTNNDCLHLMERGCEIPARLHCLDWENLIATSFSGDRSRRNAQGNNRLSVSFSFPNDQGDDYSLFSSMEIGSRQIWLPMIRETTSVIDCHLLSSDRRWTDERAICGKRISQTAVGFGREMERTDDFDYTVTSISHSANSSAYTVLGKYKCYFVSCIQFLIIGRLG